VANAEPTGIRLYGVVGLDTAQQAPLVPDTALLVYRDVGAVVGAAAYTSGAPTPMDLDAHRAVVEGVFAQRAIVPAPPGTVFRSRDALTGWLELHYFTLLEALGFVDECAVARVRVEPGDGFDERRGAAGARVVQDVSAVEPPNLEISAADAFRSLRRGATAMVTVRGDASRDAPPSVVASFLVERTHWDAFQTLVSQEAQRHPALRLASTGPWPPYDFVRMHFGR
jgi:hypothetical protein